MLVSQKAKSFHKGFDEDAGYVAPAEDGSNIEVIVNPSSDRLELLTPFHAWNGETLRECLCLSKRMVSVLRTISQWPVLG